MACSKSLKGFGKFGCFVSSREGYYHVLLRIGGPRRYSMDVIASSPCASIPLSVLVVDCFFSFS